MKALLLAALATTVAGDSWLVPGRSGNADRVWHNVACSQTKTNGDEVRIRVRPTGSYSCGPTSHWFAAYQGGGWPYASTRVVVRPHGIGVDIDIDGLDNNDRVTGMPGAGSHDNPVELKGMGYTVDLEGAHNSWWKITNEREGFFGSGPDVTIELPGNSYQVLHPGSTVSLYIGPAQ